MRIAVVIPTCDRPEMLMDALKSVSNQSRPPDEVIVVDNGTHPVDVSCLYSHDLRYVRALPRFGVAQARNLGAIVASSDFLCFLDDDDAWDDNYLRAVEAIVSRSAVDVTIGQLKDASTVAPIPGKYEDLGQEEKWIHQILVRNPGITGSSIGVRREVFMASVGFDPRLMTSEDKALVLDLLLAGATVARVPGWVRHRQHAGDRLSSRSRMLRGKMRFLGKYKQCMNFRQVARNSFTIGLLAIPSRQKLRRASSRPSDA